MKRMLSLVFGALAACTPAAQIADLRVAASEAEVAACTPTKIHSTTPGVFGAGETALEYARDETLAAAKGAGANTVLYEEGAPGDADALYVRVRGYRC